MANTGTKLVIFFITVHVLFYFAGAAEVRHTHGGENPHEQFLDNIEDEDMREELGASSDSGIFESELGVAGAAVDAINVFMDVLFAPYTAFDDTDLPDMFQLLFKTVFGVLEFIVFAAWIRGVDF